MFNREDFAPRIFQEVRYYNTGNSVCFDISWLIFRVENISRVCNFRGLWRLRKLFKNEIFPKYGNGRYSLCGSYGSYLARIYVTFDIVLVIIHAHVGIPVVCLRN